MTITLTALTRDAARLIVKECRLTGADTIAKDAAAVRAIWEAQGFVVVEKVEA